MKIGTRPMGPARESVSELALGSWHTWDRAVFEDVVELLRTAVDAGVNWFDVGVYRSKGLGSIDPYDHETDVIFAHAMKLSGLKPSQYDLSIKGWLNQPDNSVTAQVENILWRLDTDSAKYLVLGDIVGTPPDLEAIVGEIGKLIADGKVRYWAVNNWSAGEIAAMWRLAEEASISPPQFAQVKYTVNRRTVPEGEPYAALLARGMSIQSSSVFEGGLIFGSDTSRIIAVDTGSLQGKISGAAPRLKAVANELGTTVSALALAFPLLNPGVASVLIGCRSVAQFSANLGAFDLLASHSAEDIRNAVADLWLDADFDPNASWSAIVNDDAAKYQSNVR